MDYKIRKSISVWLFLGIIMVLGQVILGGITRLTDSGLSITEWDVVKGTLPPLNEEAWETAFTKYQNFAKKQFNNLHSDMTISEFKGIYFWEWFHRFWARMMGFVFLFPFIYFLIKKEVPNWLIKRLGVVVSLAALAAFFGIIMVYSGLENENRTWVSAYKLAVHLSIALVLFAYLFKTRVMYLQPETRDYSLKPYKKYSSNMLGLIFLQVIFGALMAGMRAGAINTNWPVFIGGNTLFDVLASDVSLSFFDFINYESNNYIKAIVQLLHRSMAWILFFASIIFYVRIRKQEISQELRKGSLAVIILIFVQFFLGVFTLMNYLDREMLIYLGVLHQSFAFITFIAWVYVEYQLTQKSNSTK